MGSADRLDPGQRAVALRIARAELDRRIGGAPPEALPDAPWLGRPGACFVTLSRRGELRGCVGSVRAHRPLGEDLRANSRAAALDDPRFTPVRADELDELCIEISVLSPLAPLTAADEAELHRQLCPGRHGLALESRGRLAVFLPQVWESLPEPAAFTERLRRKAGVEAGEPAARMRWWTFTVQSFSEEDGRGERI